VAAYQLARVEKFLYAEQGNRVSGEDAATE
jgi:hypothetical protein